MKKLIMLLFIATIACAVGCVSLSMKIGKVEDVLGTVSDVIEIFQGDDADAVPLPEEHETEGITEETLINDSRANSSSGEIRGVDPGDESRDREWVRRERRYRETTAEGLLQSVMQSSRLRVLERRGRGRAHYSRSGIEAGYDRGLLNSPLVSVVPLSSMV